MKRLIYPMLVTVCVTIACPFARAIQATQSGPAAPVAAQSDKSARTIVETAVRDALAVLRNPTVQSAERGQQVSTVLESHFDFETFSRLTLGPAWRDVSPAQREQFVDEFRKHVLAVCRGGTDQYGGQDIVVSTDRQEARGDWTVQTRVIGWKNGATKEVAKIDFRLRQRDERWQVIDVTIGGISMAATFRAQFNVVMRDGGIDRLLQLLREKNAAVAKPDRVAGGEK
jgi:phospholipid transport system substrate-binding protein